MDLFAWISGAQCPAVQAATAGLTATKRNRILFEHPLDKKRRMRTAFWTPRATTLRRRRRRVLNLAFFREAFRWMAAHRAYSSSPFEDSRSLSKASVAFLREMAGRSKGRRLSLSMAGVAHSLAVRKFASSTKCYMATTGYVTPATLLSRRS